MSIWDDYNWDFWNPISEPIPNEPKRIRKISFITTCMDRTNDLKITFPQNWEDNKNYPDIEFVLINYNSKDDMDEWVKNNLMNFIESGKVIYVKTTEPKFYEMGHSRNIGFKVATGEIVNNLDADNYSGKDFAWNINLLAEVRPEKAVFAKGKKRMHGRIGLYKTEFIELGGYDEDLTGYGFDDHGVVYRAMALGFKFMWWCGLVKMDRIKTPRNVVGENMKIKNWRKTEEINKGITFNKLRDGKFIVNQDKHWGKATLLKNFKEEVTL